MSDQDWNVHLALRTDDGRYGFAWEDHRPQLGVRREPKALLEKYETAGSASNTARMAGVAIFSFDFGPHSLRVYLRRHGSITQ